MDFLKYSDEELEKMLEDINFILTNRKENQTRQAMLKISQAIDDLLDVTKSAYFINQYSGDKIYLCELKEIYDEKYNVGIKMDFSTLIH